MCVCVSVAVVIQHAMRLRHIVICGLSGCTTFLQHYLLNGTIFGKTLLNIKYVFWFLLKLLSETVLILCENGRDVITNVRYSCHILMKLEFSLQAFEKYSNIKFHENPSSGS